MVYPCQDNIIIFMKMIASAASRSIWPGGTDRYGLAGWRRPAPSHSLPLAAARAGLGHGHRLHCQCRAGGGFKFKSRSQVFKLARGRRFAGPGSEPEPEPRSGLGTHPCKPEGSSSLQGKSSSSLQGKNYSRQSRFFPGRPDRGRPPAWRRTVNFKFRVPSPRAGCHHDPSH
jgi:hypothetical protein